MTGVTGRPALLAFPGMDIGDLEALHERLSHLALLAADSLPLDPDKHVEPDGTIVPHETLYQSRDGSMRLLVQLRDNPLGHAARSIDGTTSYVVTGMEPVSRSFTFEHPAKHDGRGIVEANAPSSVIVRNVSAITASIRATIDATHAGNDPLLKQPAALTDANNRFRDLLTAILHAHNPHPASAIAGSLTFAADADGLIKVSLAPNALSSRVGVPLLTREAMLLIRDKAHPQGRIETSTTNRLAYVLKPGIVSGPTLSKPLDEITIMRNLADIPTLPEQPLSQQAIDLIAHLSR